jgi:membrane associated rhomboid family serine protease
MLIIPLTGKISKRNLPIATIGIILINCFVFFILQAGDEERYLQAMEFYFESDLGKMEMSRYLAHVGGTDSEESILTTKKQKGSNEAAIIRLYGKMQSDEVFMKRLLNDGIITPQDQIYTTWKSLRRKYEGMLSRVVSQGYGFKPAEKSFVTSFTHMFLHGSFMHLLGNMIFLWLVGCVLELGCGRVLYVAMYLLCGILAVGLFALVYMDSRVPLVGASGAISGLMGAYTVLYGKKKIKVFYSLGFYFNYAKVYAILMLPTWIGKEVFQLFFGGFSQVAYVAHIGGLASGAALGYVNLKFLGQVSEEVFGEEPKEKIAPLLEEALQRIGRLEMNGARPLLEQVLEIDPNNRSALTHLFNIDKLNPENARFHKTVSELLHHLTNDSEAHEALYATYKEVRRISKKLRLSLDLLFRIASTFSAHGYLEESEKIMAMLLQERPGYQKLPIGILRLAQAYLKKGMIQKGKKCLLIICRRYPESAESQVARQLLTGSN